MAKEKLTVSTFKLSKNWFDFLLDNPDLVSGNHTALYMWLVELNNRLSWVEKFGISVREGMDGMACKSRKTYSNCLKDLIEWGFVVMIKEGKNQYVCNVIALVKNTQARVQQIPKQGYSTGTSTDTHPQTNEPLNFETFKTIDDDVKAQARKNQIEEAIADYTGNVAFEPQQAHIPDEKEKNSAKKEKVLPTLDEAVAKLADTAYWRHVLEHHKQTETERLALFKIFYEQKEDRYRNVYPTAADMVEHFYNWVPIHLNKASLQKLMTNGKSKLNGNSNAAGNRAERNNGIADIIDQSENFLQQYPNIDY